MFRRRKEGKSTGPWYFWHPVTGRRTTTGTADRAFARAIVAKAEREALQRRAGIFVPEFVHQTDIWLELNAALAGRRAQAVYAAFWKKHLEARSLSDITKELVHSIIREHRPITLDAPSTANNTANNYVAFVAKIMRSAEVTPPKFHAYPPLRQSKRWLRPEEWAALGRVMYEDLRHAATFSIATGLRESNVMFFEWAWLHGDKAFLPRAVTKTDEEYGIPLGQTALRIVEERKAAKVRHPKYVFVNRGRPWYQKSYFDAVQEAAQAAQIAPINVHTFRHTFASWLTQQGVPDSIRRRLGCWSLGTSADTGYQHFDVEWLRQYAERLDGILCPTSVSAVRQVIDGKGRISLS